MWTKRECRESLQGFLIEQLQGCSCINWVGKGWWKMKFEGLGQEFILYFEFEMPATDLSGNFPVVSYCTWYLLFGSHVWTVDVHIGAAGTWTFKAIIQRWDAMYWMEFTNHFRLRCLTLSPGAPHSLEARVKRSQHENQREVRMTNEVSGESWRIHSNSSHPVHIVENSTVKSRKLGKEKCRICKGQSIYS